ncbi:hypothetical protein COR50_14610 [Chitinophaga caeni]|uniref:Uncharacterized protein n=1 Tax=Chitinophaga caeni TaxID=2029983 RepID=A0A291QWI7_9BACT|nr:hypothetical protein [Chitinophaga caeni]ATL48297.1 hypothetical protein COR50_14610 [Chitinophaga caeni]
MEFFQQLLEANGQFQYQAKSFSLKLPGGRVRYHWNEVSTIFGGQDNEVSSGDLYVDLFFKDGSQVRVKEEMEGWYRFLKELVAHFPGLEPDWDIDISSPINQSNLTLLYDKLKRSMPRALEDCYDLPLI